MTNISHDISKTIDPITVEILEIVNRAANELSVPYFLVGAKARDILLHHVLGANVQRATLDYDFAIEIKDWAVFERCKAKLIENGFEQDRQAQRVVKGVVKIDLIPFGQVAGDNRQIDWPPEGDFRMSVVGFDDVLRWIEYFRVREEPVLDIPVISAPGLTLLKLLAWLDRAADIRKKDALDLAYVFNNIERDPAIRDRVYEGKAPMEQYDWDLALASSHLLGHLVHGVAGEEATKIITEFHQGRLKKLDINRLINEMCKYHGTDAEFERNQQLLNAFFNGFITS